jgi:hypothetical protein
MNALVHRQQETDATAQQGEHATAQPGRGQSTVKGAAIGEHTAPPPSALIADLWALFDAACRDTNALLAERGHAPIFLRQTPAERRYSVPGLDERERFIAIIPLMPTALGHVRCGAYIGVRHQCIYVEPASSTDPARWQILSSGADFDHDAARELFRGVFGVMPEGARTRRPARRIGSRA